jgi:hypothetical protein
MCKGLRRVKTGRSFVKWGNMDKILLNRVISVRNVKLEGKNWNLLLKLQNTSLKFENKNYV